MSALYTKLIDELLEKIATMNNGDKLPSERQLCKDYDVSRTTVRNAIGYLVNSGILYQIQGKGTFIRERDRENLSNYYSFTEQTKKNGKTPKSLVVDYAIRDANNKLKDKMKLKDKEKVIQFDRLRLADNVPMMYEKTTIPYGRFSQVDKNLLEKKALYDIFRENFKVSIYQIKERFSVSELDSEMAKSLGLKKNSPCLKIIRTTFDIEENIIEYTISYARGDMFYYETSYKPQ